MANHLTPTELAREAGLERREVISKCMEMGVPIFQGRIDKALFLDNLRRLGAAPPAGRGVADPCRSRAGSPARELRADPARPRFRLAAQRPPRTGVARTDGLTSARSSTSLRRGVARRRCSSVAVR